jgi:hypothetical protein
MCAGIAHAQLPVTPEQVAQSSLTSYQIARDTALVACNQQLGQQNLSQAQSASFLEQCVRAQRVVEPPPDPAVPSPQQ